MSRKSRRDEEDEGEVDVGYIPQPPKHLPSIEDPTGATDVFRASGVPNIEGAVEGVYEYVQEKAKEVNLEIKRNRGIPPNAETGSMLTVEEKALVILGKACGVIWQEVRATINRHRAGSGRDLLPPGKKHFFQRVVKDYGPVVESVQADLLDSMEAWSPLSSGQNRIVWRAKSMEFYRQEILWAYDQDEMYFATETTPGRVGKQNAIKRLDAGMRSHLEFFDKLIVEDLGRFLKGPGGQLREQAAVRQQEAITKVYKDFEEGKIDEVEKVMRLRDLIHREGDSEKGDGKEDK